MPSHADVAWFLDAILLDVENWIGVLKVTRTLLQNWLARADSSDNHPGCTG